MKSVLISSLVADMKLQGFYLCLEKKSLKKKDGSSYLNLLLQDNRYLIGPGDLLKIKVFGAEEYTNSGVEIAYTVASGLTAYINVEDYEYKAGTSGGTADSGTASKLTIKASF